MKSRFDNHLALRSLCVDCQGQGSATWREGSKTIFRQCRPCRGTGIDFAVPQPWHIDAGPAREVHFIVSRGAR